MASSMQDPDERPKRALIIANDEYHRENRLDNCVSNAQQLDNKLKSINFKVQTAYNLAKHEMINNIIDFSRTIGDGDLVLFYFSGHGYQVDNNNYLMPVDDDRIENTRDVEDFAVNVEQMFSRLVKANRSYVNIFILDCCRPYALKSGSKASCKYYYSSCTYSNIVFVYHYSYECCYWFTADESI